MKDDTKMDVNNAVWANLSEDTKQCRVFCEQDNESCGERNLRN